MDQEEASGPTLPHSTFGCNIMVKFKFCLFIPCFYVFLNSKNPCSIWCTLFMYIFLFKKIKKKIQDSQIFPKKREKFSNKKKSLWTKGIELLSHLKKKKKILELGALGFLVNFFQKRPIFFLSKISRFFKIFFSKWYMRIPWTKLFLNYGV